MNKANIIRQGIDCTINLDFPTQIYRFLLNKSHLGGSFSPERKAFRHSAKLFNLNPIPM